MNKVIKAKVQQTTSTETLILEKQIRNPQKLKMLILSGSNLVKEQFLFIMKCKNLIKLDLSNSNLNKFPKDFSLINLTRLRFLHLHNNKFKNIEDLKPIFETINLIYLTLQNNLFPTNSRVEHFIINVIKKLKVINDRVIFEEQRISNIMIIKPFVKISLDLFSAQNSEVDQKYYIRLLDIQSFYINKIWYKHNPLIKIQRLWKKWLQKKKIQQKIPKLNKISRKNELKIENVFLDEYFKFWKQYVEVKKSIRKQLQYQDKSYLLIIPIQSYRINLRNLKVKNVLQNYILKIREKIRMRKAVQVFVKQLSQKTLVFNSQYSFYNILELDIHKRIIFSKPQRHLITNLLEHCKIYMSSQNLKIPSYSIINSTSYITVRYVEQERLQRKKNQSMYNIFLYPSMRCIFLNRKKVKLLKNSFVKIINIQQLPHIQRLNMRLTKQQTQKSNKKYEKITKYVTNEYYESGLQFKCEDPYFFKLLLRVIFYHNKQALEFKKLDKKQNRLSFLDNYQQKFIFYVDKQLKRSISAVIIQKFWKRYITKKQSKENLYENINRGRAAQRIQKFWRELNFQHRIFFDVLLNDYLRQFENSTLYLQSQIYMQLYKLRSTKQLYKKLKLWINHTSEDLLLTWEHTKKIFSSSSYTFFNEKPINKTDYIIQGDIYNILHLDSQVSIVNFGTNSKCYAFKFKNLSEARKRAAFLAVLTYRYKHNGFFIKLFQKQQLNNKSIEEYEIKLNKLYNINLRDKRIIEIIYKEKKVQNPEKIFIYTDRITKKYEKKQLENPKKFDVQFFENQNNGTKPIKLIDTFFSKMVIVIHNSNSKQIVKQQKYIEIESKIKKENSHKKKEFHYKQLLKQKKLSFYDISWRQSQTKKNKSTLNLKQQDTIQNFYGSSFRDLKKEEIKSIQYESQTQKKRMVQKMRQNESSRKILIDEKQKLDLSHIRKMYTQQKSRNMNLKFLRQNQEYLFNKLKVQKIEELRKQKKLLKQIQSENDFVQKGNFLSKQQFKLIMIKNKILDKQKKRQNINKIIESKHSSFLKKKQLSKVSVSQQKSIQLNDHQIINQNKGRKSLKAINPLLQYQSQHKINQNNNKLNSEKQIQLVIQFQQGSEDFKTFQAIKKKKDKLIHGVFPQQFYAINKRHATLQLPKI